MIFLFPPERTYLYNVATRQPGPPPTRSNSYVSPTPSQQPPAFLGVDSNAFRSVTSSDPEMLNWSGFEMQCFPGYNYYAAAYQGAYPSPSVATGVVKVPRTFHRRAVNACEEVFTEPSPSQQSSRDGKPQQHHQLPHYS